MDVVDDDSKCLLGLNALLESKCFEFHPILWKLYSVCKCFRFKPKLPR